jgi:uncharacterized membrane protein
MSAADMVIIVISGFFLVGVMAGIAVVYALSARRADRAHRRSRPESARDANRRGKSGLPV